MRSLETQKELIYKNIIRVWRVGDTFTFDWIYESCETDFRTNRPENNNVRDSTNKACQRLRDDGDIEFVDNSGTYRRLR